jgi:hypothetical protein
MSVTFRGSFGCPFSWRDKETERNGTTEKWPPHEESNLDFRFRRPVFYPLNYGEAKLKF